MGKNILLIGGGGHCKSVIDTLLSYNQFDKIGIIDKKENVGTGVLGVPVIGEDKDLHKLFHAEYAYAFITLGNIGTPEHRIRLFRMIIEIGFEIPNIIDETATISKHTTLDKGIYVGKRAIINAGTEVKQGAIINTACLAEHDCKIDMFAHIAPRAVLCGGVCVGENTFIGANATVKQNIKIGANVVVGMGSVVLEDISNDKTVYGNPAKEVCDQ